jgi:hypothetical protein
MVDEILHGEESPSDLGESGIGPDEGLTVEGGVGVDHGVACDEAHFFALFFRGAGECLSEPDVIPLGLLR